VKFSGKVGNGPVNKTNFGGDPGHRLDTGIVFRIRQYWEIRKVVNGHLLLIVIHQMAALVRRALAKVCTVPMLLHCVSKKDTTQPPMIISTIVV